MITMGKDNYKVTLKYFPIGQDILIIITGGEEHIGSLSLSQKDFCSTLSKKGHRERLITESAAPMIQNALNRDTLVVCGIHINDATTEEIKLLLENIQKCVNIFLKEFNA